ncbi:hypothetical protein DJ69_16980 [Halorubrum persicum]|uniref:UspA domain-containing protein n=1 Tax=Halorubrum persicum TaxID=1383844 RepID=A0A2G1WEQ1_9EURY|nr:universal stress protein [Halorubrum persicum]PHQ37452.1 hypothetical protein DJ69_16980 [Halorubrum persicum]
MSETVLVPIDGSDPADAAVSFAFETFPDAHHVLFHVINPLETALDSSPEAVTEEFWSQRIAAAQTQSEAILGAAERRVRDADVSAEVGSKIGPPARAIVDAAEERDADQIVMGSHGRTGLSRIALGSVAETVLRRAPVPVTVVHGDEA